MTYVSTADHAATIRADLKRLHGITSRQVSVKSRSYSMGSSIDISIHDPAIDAREVENVARKHERIDRCEVTGEILSGCNRYLHVGYSDRATDAYFAAHKADLLAALSAGQAQGPGYLAGAVIGDRHILIGPGDRPETLVLYRKGEPDADGHRPTIGRPAIVYAPANNAPEAVAEYLGRLLLTLRND